MSVGKCLIGQGCQIITLLQEKFRSGPTLVLAMSNNISFSSTWPKISFKISPFFAGRLGNPESKMSKILTLPFSFHLRTSSTPHPVFRDGRHQRIHPKDASPFESPLSSPPPDPSEPDRWFRPSSHRGAPPLVRLPLLRLAGQFVPHLRVDAPPNCGLGLVPGRPLKSPMEDADGSFPLDDPAGLGSALFALFPAVLLLVVRLGETPDVPPQHVESGQIRLRPL